MRYARIKTPDFLVLVPKDYIVVNDANTAQNTYPCVVAEKNNTIPHFVVLWDKPVEEMTEDDETRIFDICAKICPKVKDVLNEEVVAIYDTNGRVINAEEWMKSPRLGIFGIKEVNSKKELFNNAGIKRRV